MMRRKKLCYVYEYRMDGVVRYVGKGTGNRDQIHLAIAAQLNARRARGEMVRSLRWYNELAKALRAGRTIEIVHVADGLTDMEAFALEAKIITDHGRSDLGSGALYNAADGGQGFTSKDSQRMWSDLSFRKRQRQAVVEWHAKPDVKRRRAIAHKAAMARPEVRARISETSKITKSDPEYRARASYHSKQLWLDVTLREQIRESMRRALSSPEARRLKSEAAKLACARPETRARKSVAAKECNNRPEVKEKMRLALRAYWQRRRDAGDTKRGKWLT